MSPTSKLQSFTPQTITSKAQLAREIAKVREKGFALDLEEFVPEPVLRQRAGARRDDGAPIAAISIAMPKMRFKRALAGRLARADAGQGGRSSRSSSG